MRNLILVFLLLSTLFSKAQFVTQTANGKGSIPLPLKGLGVSVDVGKAEIAFGLNNYGRVFDSIKNSFFLGVSITGKNSEGLSNLFSSGDIVAEGNASGLVGYSISNNKNILKEYDTSSIYRTIRLQRDSLDTLIRKIYPDTFLIIVKSKGNLISNPVQRQIVINELSEKIKKADLNTFGDLLLNYRANDNDLKNYMLSVITDHKVLLTNITVRYEAIQNRIKDRLPEKNAIFAKSVTPWRLSIFSQGGIKARSFKRYLGTALPDFNKSFKDTLYRGGFFGLGVNFQIKDFTFGVSYSYSYTDNFANLTSKDYTIRTTDNSNSQQLIQEKKLTAYSGAYARVEVNEFNADVLYSIKLDQTDTARLLLNPYVRASLFSRDTASLKNYTNIGMGFYFLGKQRKFIGGLYIELPDVDNNIERAKPAAEQNIQSPFKRLSFGIATKINISSVFGFTNRPRKPDL